MTEEKKKVLIFWVRFALWTISACLAPVGFIAWRFKLFETVSTISISGWGILAIVIIAIFVISLAKYLKKGLPYSLATQCISGVCKITIPLLALFLALNYMKTNLDIFIQALGCVLICETVAIPLNPMPKWANDNNIETSEENLISLLSKAINKKEGK